MALRQVAGNAVYDEPFSGQLAGSTTAAQLPNIPARLVKFKAQYGNSGKVYLGTSSGVTKAAGGGASASNDETTGYQLAGGDETGWLEVDNLSRYWLICDNATDNLTYTGLR